MSSPDISVVMPIYNTAQWVRQTLDCVCLNSYKNLEIICVLDAPTDGSDKIVKDYAKTDSRIIIIEQKENKGHGASRNVGLKHATGEWVHFMDADDLISLDFYKNMLAATKFTDVDATLCGNVLHENMVHRALIYSPMFMSNFGDIAKITNGGVAAVWVWMFNRKFLNRINFGFPEGMIMGEDYIAMGNAISNVTRICTAKDATYIYKRRRESVTTKKEPTGRRTLEFSKGRLFVNELSKQSGGEPMFELEKTKKYLRNIMQVNYYVNGDKEILFSWRIGKKKWKI